VSFKVRTLEKFAEALGSNHMRQKKKNRTVNQTYLIWGVVKVRNAGNPAIIIPEEITSRFFGNHSTDIRPL
jgi:hypothetical protein